QAGTGANEPAHDVTVRIKGRSQEPVIELESKPNDWDEAKILEELTVLRFYDPKQGFQGVTQTLGDPLDNYLTRAINRTLSAGMPGCMPSTSGFSRAPRAGLPPRCPVWL